MDLIPAPFLAMRSQMPGVSALSASQAANASWSANSISGSSAGMQLDPLAGRVREREPVGGDLVPDLALQHVDHRVLTPHDLRLAGHLRHRTEGDTDRV